MSFLAKTTITVASIWNGQWREERRHEMGKKKGISVNLILASTQPAVVGVQLHFTKNILAVALFMIANLISFCKSTGSLHLGHNSIGSILTIARKKFGFKGRKVSCHFVRKTCLSRLLDANVPEVFVAQHAGMKSIDSLSSYKAGGPKQISTISSVLSNDMASSTDHENQFAGNSTITNAQVEQVSSQETNTSTSNYKINASGISNCSNCVFNFLPSSPSPSKSKKSRRAFRIIKFSSDDDE